MSNNMKKDQFCIRILSSILIVATRKLSLLMIQWIDFKFINIMKVLKQTPKLLKSHNEFYLSLTFIMPLISNLNNAAFLHKGLALSFLLMILFIALYWHPIFCGHLFALFQYFYSFLKCNDLFIFIYCSTFSFYTQQENIYINYLHNP